MSDLREDLRSYFDRVTDEVRSGKAEPAPHVVKRSSPGRWVIAAAAIVVVLGTVAGVSMVGSQDRVGEVRADGVATPAQIRSGWERVPDAFPDDAFVNDITSGPAGFVAVGLTFVPNGATTDPTEPAVWYSADGRIWDPTATGPRGDGSGEAFAVVYWRDAYYALVNVADDTSLWRSGDGQAWTRFASAPAMLGGNQTRLYADDALLIAFGLDGAWVTSDASSWSVADLDAPVTGISRDGDRLVALTGRSSTTGSASAFDSTDGLHWTLDQDLGPEVDPGGSAIVLWHATTWASTYPGSEDERSALWAARRDGAWEEFGANNPPGSGFDTLTAIGPYLVATGFDANSRPGGWVSTNGQDWISMPDLDRPLGGRLNLSTSDGRTVVAASTSELRDVYLWRAPGSSSTDSTTISRADSSTTGPTVVVPGTGDPRSIRPERLGPSVVVVEGSSASGPWALSVYQSTSGLCRELQHGAAAGGGCGPLDPSAINTGSTSGADGQFVFGNAPLDAVEVRVVYADGTTMRIPTVASPEFGVLFFAGEVDRDQVVERTVALAANGTPLAAQSIPAPPKR